MAHLELARHLNDDFAGVAVALDQGINHLAQLVQADVNGGVGNLAVALFVVLRVVFGKGDMSAQRVSVVRQLVERLEFL